MITNSNKFRWVVRSLFLAGFAALVLLSEEPSWQHAVVPGCSPFAGLIALITGGCTLVMLPALLFFLISLFKVRFFCRWVCPVGTCFDAAAKKFPKRGWIAKLPRLGGWFLCVGAGAALIGFPLFVVLDPMMIFPAAFGWVRDDLDLWEKIHALIFPFMVLVAMAAPWLWCGRMCPVGALQDIVYLPYKWIGARLRPDAVRFKREQTVDTGRRVFMGLGLGAGYRLLLNPASVPRKSRCIRPPSSGSDARFTTVCTRCGACARACPRQIIKQSGADGGFAGVLAPEIDFSRGDCPPTCTRCGEACATGAIPRFTVENKFDSPMGVAEIELKRCLLVISRRCGMCIRACPYRALFFRWDPARMVPVLLVDKRRCTGCGTCQYVCPVKPVAIVVKPC